MVKKQAKNKISEKTTIELTRINRNKLNALKDFLGASTFDEVVGSLLKIVSEYKIKGEMKDKYFS